MFIDSDDLVQSKLTLGGFDSQKFTAKGSQMAWHDLKPSKDGKFNHWRLHMDSLKFGDFEIKDTEIESVIVDSGTSLVLMPEKEFKKLI
jgi:hypothetical protein